MLNKKKPIFNSTLKKFVDTWPGRKWFGMYRFMPIFFLFGAALEYSMINWQVGEVNFYTVYSRKQAHKEAIRQLQEEVDKNYTSG